MSVWLWLVTTGAMAAKTPQKIMMRPSKVLAAAITGTATEISATPEVATQLQDLGFDVKTITDEAFATDVANDASSRVRALGTVPESIYEAAVRSNSVVLDQPVLADGRRELMPYLLEQAVSVTMHRFGIIRNVGNLRDE